MFVVRVNVGIYPRAFLRGGLFSALFRRVGLGIRPVTQHDLTLVCSFVLSILLIPN